MKNIKKLLTLVILLAVVFCKKEEGVVGNVSSIGVGPVEKIEPAEISPALAEEGKSLYDAKCMACHIMGKKSVGPDLEGVTKRRSPEWIMNMILNPEEMTKQDVTAQALLKEYYTQMTFQNLTQQEARSLLEYFRNTDKAKN